MKAHYTLEKIGICPDDLTPAQAMLIIRRLLREESHVITLGGTADAVQCIFRHLPLALREPHRGVCCEWDMVIRTIPFRGKDIPLSKHMDLLIHIYTTTGKRITLNKKSVLCYSDAFPEIMDDLEKVISIKKKQSVKRFSRDSMLERYGHY